MAASTFCLEPCTHCEGTGTVDDHAGEDALGASSHQTTHGTAECGYCDGTGERPVTSCQACGRQPVVGIVDGVACCGACLDDAGVTVDRGDDVPLARAS